MVLSVLSYITHLCRLTEQQGYVFVCAIFVYSCSRFRATRGRWGVWSECVMRIHLYSIRQCACSQVFPLQLCCSIALFRDSSTKPAQPHCWVIWLWMFAAAPVKAPVSLASFYLCARPVQTRQIDEASSSETVNPRVSVVQYVQRREVKKERARGTSPPLVGSHGCVRAHYVRSASLWQLWVKEGGSGSC